MARARAGGSRRLTGLLVTTMGLALLFAACSSTQHVERNDTLSRHGIAAAGQVPSVEAVMQEGDPVDWAKQGIGHFERGDFEMAAPYFEAALESRRTHLRWRAMMYWLAAVSYSTMDDVDNEVRHLELFVMAVENLEPEHVEGLVFLGKRGNVLGVQQARTVARAQLFAYRVERGDGFGRSTDNAVLVESFDEENLILNIVRCGEERSEHIELLNQEVVEEGSRRYDRFETRCSKSGNLNPLVFDTTTAFATTPPSIGKANQDEGEEAGEESSDE